MEIVFQSLNKGLNLILEAPFREPFANGLWRDHPGRNVAFVRGWFKTDDEKLVEELKRHRLFSNESGRPGTFWIYVAPPDPSVLLAEKEKEIERLRKELDDEKAAKAARRLGRPLKDIATESVSSEIPVVV